MFIFCFFCYFSVFYQVSWFILLGSSEFGFYFGSVLVISSGHCCVYFFRVLFGARGLPCGSLLFLSFVSFAMLRCFERIRFVEGLSSSTHAKTRLRLTFLFHSSSAFLSAGLILRYRNAVCLMRFMLEPCSAVLTC